MVVEEVFDKLIDIFESHNININVNSAHTSCILINNNTMKLVEFLVNLESHSMYGIIYLFGTKYSKKPITDENTLIEFYENALVFLKSNNIDIDNMDAAATIFYKEF